jgi:hypothetical protein
LVGTTADLRRFDPRGSLLLNDLPGENRGTAGRIGEVGLSPNAQCSPGFFGGNASTGSLVRVINAQSSFNRNGTMA